MNSKKNEIQPETAELRNEIAALDADLTEDFKAQFSTAPFLSRKTVSFQGNKGKPAYGWYKYKEAFSAELVEYFYSDLVTAPEDIRAGFVALALERSRQATPFVEQARALKVSAMSAKRPKDLLDIEGIQTALLTAAGFSEKATKQTTEKDQIRALQDFIEKFLEPAGTNFVEESESRAYRSGGDRRGSLATTPA